jgi:hypothetical protein
VFLRWETLSPRAAHTSDAASGAIRGQFVAVPEPASGALLALGIALLARARRRS